MKKWLKTRYKENIINIFFFKMRYFRHFRYSLPSYPRQFVKKISEQRYATLTIKMCI